MGDMKGKKYYRIDNYSMKCRLYPSKDCAEKIDAAIKGVQTFYNATLYEIFHNGNCVIEKEKTEKDAHLGEKILKENEDRSRKRAARNHREYKPYEKHEKFNNDKVLHYINTKEIVNAIYIRMMEAEHPVICDTPHSAITCKSGIIADIKKSTGIINPNTGSYIQSPVEWQEPNFYSKSHPRRSYSYQESFTKIKLTDNPSVLKIDLCRVGLCKIRGWDKKLRFGDEANMNFAEWIGTKNSKDKVTITISKDACGDYYIVFKLPYAYKLIKENNENVIGIDVGIKDLIITSDEKKYHNERYKKKKLSQLKALNRKLSRRWGYSNPEFKKAVENCENPTPSKSYEKTKLKYARLSRKIERQKDNLNDKITTEVVSDNGFIGIEALTIQEMFGKNHRMNREISDAAMYDILNKIEYKSRWYGRKIQTIGKYEPSTKRCNCCGYVLPKIDLDVREWTCPNCGDFHDRDINAAKNIRDVAWNMYLENGNQTTERKKNYQKKKTKKSNKVA